MKTNKMPIKEFVEFDRLRLQIMMNFKKNNYKIAMFSSANDKAGKTFHLYNLSMNFISRTNAKILLIDMNLRNPELHQLFGLKNDIGLIEALDEENETIPSGVIQHTAFKNLDVITLKKHYHQHFNIDRVKNFVHTISGDYDYVFIDTSPVLVMNKNNIDPTLISTIVDQVFFIVLSRRTQKDWIYKAKEMFEGVGSKIDNVIMNYQFTPIPALNSKGHVSFRRIFKDKIMSLKIFKKNKMMKLKVKKQKKQQTEKGSTDETK